MVDDVMAEKIESLQRCIRRVEAKVPASAALLQTDLDAQDILTVNLERAAQQVVDLALHVLSTRDIPLPNNMADCIRALVPLGLTASTADRMAKAVGFRNLSVHAYRAVDWQIVHVIATQHMDDFRAFIREVASLQSSPKKTQKP